MLTGVAAAAATTARSVGTRLAARGATRLLTRAGTPRPQVVVVAGRIELVGGGAQVRHLSHVTAETFYAPDLNKIAATVRNNQARNVTDPQTPSQQLYVDNEGNIIFGDEVGQVQGRRLSKVTQETFYDLYSKDLALVRQVLPAGTTWASDGEVGGWLFAVTNEFADRYELFLWWDAASATYKVSLVEPRLGGTVNVHDCHLYADGTLCLKREGGAGYPRLEAAYARSVLWTRGASFYRRGYGFQFNADQTGQA